MYDLVDYTVIDISQSKQDYQGVEQLLSRADLKLDSQVTIFVVAKFNTTIIACAGIDRDIIKCVAVDPDYRGNQLNLTLMDHTIKYANENGYFHLFLYTKPENIDFFKGCGFYPIVEITDLAVLMENTPVGIRQYCKKLNTQQKEGEKIGSIVMNANPFTKGHQYLIQYAASQCDWLHVFVVNENASLFSFETRLQLVKDGSKHIKNVTVHASSPYIISRATFPTYFLKDKAKIDRAYMGIDLLIFRNYIAPALNITYRFVGTEPYDEVTKAYNEAMSYWLEDKAISVQSAITVVEVPRITEGDTIVSASLVRKLLASEQYEQVKKLVPPTTWNYLSANLDKFKI
ncbi:[citrate (pro-3S)-lyase] ligase [Gilliamella sp. Pra-s65]|uniref:[citrate (pro-3S)-lyase] ligase n=1 Tax=unclassified Gilliamella TaxID=2685620 RepID=UPI001328B6C0|nr:MULTISPECIES: [citrate (pro-3S)-lyase] ligase [unclassified Gilliamella]MWN31528.1 [citrate (pro-3S)-lyase] ligase [Gilliamella sp. Pra-s60]MWN89716.1 [citrate (pro-3S)-lyase] ligase [Gilliamella sp. Pra-s65]MWP28635.1 [citrate (pro-3S)-lyase] ligase [Gilliamella sp. Pra-s54]MWP47241.1 [citrate (pro-3S)-lyase] ligase [Gilliamella sp. Pas-s27]MWP72724.1 [citrate (pro-3S)-lyase] ligase [Gilliamella sp. Pra-s52]